LIPHRSDDSYFVQIDKVGAIMKKLVFAAACVLAACSGPENATEPATEGSATPETETAASTTVDGGTMAGTYESISNEGLVLIQTLADDGTVTSTDAEGNVVNGTYTGSAEQFCITNDGESDATCYAYGSLDENGSWTATNEADPDDVWTIRRVN
jgi:hypothetical protein